MNENAIRDLLAKDLSVLEVGLELVEIEQFIPPELGTRCFLDILAKDRSGHWVIIEVKKTKAASREAAHEVFKYVEAVQRHFGARNNEIRAIVASVEWGEMLVPFSKLISETTIFVEGVQLVLDDSEILLKVNTIEPLVLTQGRYLAPWHELNVYHSKANLEMGIESYYKCCNEKGIIDYVLVVLKAADDFHDRACMALEAYGKGLSNDLPRSEYILYFAPQILTKEKCLSIIARDPNLYEEVISVTSDVDEKAELCILHTNVYDVEPCPSRDFLEIGYDAKFAGKLLVDEGWAVVRIIRKGTFERNHLLSDDSIIEELKGLSAGSGRGLNQSINLDNVAHVDSVRKALNSALELNAAWKAQLNRVLDEITDKESGGTADIKLFNPSSGIFTLYFMATEESSLDHMPHYKVVVKSSSEVVTSIYLGVLVPSQKPMEFNDILEKYYEGRVGKLMLTASVAGFYEPKDTEILYDIGLSYRTFRLDDPDGNKNWFELRDDLWREFSPVLPFNPLQKYFDNEALLINQIVETIGSRMHGAFHDMS